MTSTPPRPADRRPQADLWRHRPEAVPGGARPEAGDGRARTPGPPGSGEPGEGEQARDAEVTLAIFGYLAAAFLGPVIPLGIYLIGRRLSPTARHHAVMALNLSLTGLLYAVCCLILLGVLLLDSVATALVIAIPVALALWLSEVRYLLRGIGAANRGERPAAPAWICARIVRA